MWAWGWGSRRHRGLRVWVLQMLSRGPMNGAEIMEQMDRMTMGWWRPSPGSIYPLLDQLEKDQLVTKGEDGRYRLTDQARTGPDWLIGSGVPGFSGPRDPEEAAQVLDSYVHYLEDVGQSGRLASDQLNQRLREIAQRLDRIAKGSGVRPK